MRSQDDSLKAASVNDLPEYIPEEEIYKKKTKRLKLRRNILHSICNIAFLLMLVCFLLCSAAKLMEKRDALHTPVSADDLYASTDIIDTGQYEADIQSDYIKDGKNYYSLTMGGYTTERTEKQISLLGSDTVCDTRIYTLTIYNDEPIFLSFFIPDSITIVRYSVLNEKPFKDEEIEEYKEKAASYFTYLTYDKLRFDDASDYYINIKGLVEEKN